MMNAMVTMLDRGVANVTRALKENNMWNNTLIVFSAGGSGGRQVGAAAWPRGSVTRRTR